MRCSTGGTPAPDALNNTQAGATNIGAFGGARARKVYSSVGTGEDTGDWYRFRVDSTLRFVINLTNLQADVDLALYEADGTRITNSTKTGTKPELIARALAPGWYAVCVDPYRNAESTYRLRLVSSPLQPAGAGVNLSSRVTRQEQRPLDTSLMEDLLTVLPAVDSLL